MTWVVAVWVAWQFAAGRAAPGRCAGGSEVAPWAARTIIFLLVLLIGWAIGMLLGYFSERRSSGP